jgi:hypothetical protein
MGNVNNTSGRIEMLCFRSLSSLLFITFVSASHPCPAFFVYKILSEPVFRLNAYSVSYWDLASTDGSDGEISRFSPSGHLFFIGYRRNNGEKICTCHGT